jgi:hypothetical protein
MNHGTRILLDGAAERNRVAHDLGTRPELNGSSHYDGISADAVIDVGMATHDNHVALHIAFGPQGSAQDDDISVDFAAVNDRTPDADHVANGLFAFNDDVAADANAVVVGARL